MDWVNWLRLEQTPGVGNETARKLLSVFGLPEQIFAASHSALAAVVPDRIARAILSTPADFAEQVDKTGAWQAQPGNLILTLADATYPRLLLEIPDPPLMLYVKGRADLLDVPAVAVVGSRNATVQGIRNAEQFSEALSVAGLCISSGLAAGIDAAAHQGALRGSGSTVAVIGTGADIVYPARNRSLAHLIAEGGCIVSEYSLGTPALAPNFPRRNRIISGLAKGVLVVEAAAQSGSLITARMAAEQGREVFAIPGSIHSPLSKGCHQLIRQGAKLVESADHILEELQFSIASKTAMAATEDVIEHELLKEIAYDPIHLDMLASRTGMDIAILTTELLGLELNGQLEALPGGYFRRLA
ncbi:DNA-processing protein DprA [Undibacterium sp. TS12]|uniref:DNA-processing protein DprA n=1 Tax=Undibacterium sp. TS12 TaxID=2908202 RepID=UPI001F4CE698|nr:DNA-processing protein DprA [Undibacterium sp. TS12]MCH8621382.1 DNA-processing protein DprA [Undibacterium sp. TS12]